MDKKIRIGVSSCLLGNPVRYDGGHKRDRYITDVLAKYFHFVPVCPEVECGLPIPRETMRLVGDIENPQLITRNTGVNYTEKMLSYCHQRVIELEEEDLCGFIFKKDSPSSGLHRVKIFISPYNSIKASRGLFAASVVNHYKVLPVEEEGRLKDAILRENFIEQVFCYSRWKEFLLDSPNYKRLIDFHARHKLLLMSHSPKYLSTLGKMVAGGKRTPDAELLHAYEVVLMEAMSIVASVKKHVNVLHHIMGYFKKVLTKDEKAELLEIINQYAKRMVPLVVPLTLINHYIRKYDTPYLKNQVYLEPHPSELMLRNHV